MDGRLSGRAFVGRVVELGRLEDALATLPDAGATTVLISGDAGIGKSRLIEEFCRLARTRGALVVTGVCTPADGGGLPYGPIVGAVRDASRQLSTSDVGRTLGPLRGMLGLDGASSDHEAARLTKTNLFETLLQSVDALAESATLVLVFEDLQWADSASIEAVDFLTRNLGATPVLLVASSRSDEIAQDGRSRKVMSEMKRHRRTVEIELAGLDDDEIAQLLNSVLGRPPEWALLDAVTARSGGNPFFVEELAAARHATVLPRHLRNVVMMRLEGLSDAARHVIAAAAVHGGPTHHLLLSAVTSLSVADLDRALAEAVEHQVLVADQDDGCLHLRHALLREAVYDALLPGERGRLHKALAEALAANPALDRQDSTRATFRIADHWWGAGEWQEAFVASMRAGERAAALHGMPEAQGYFERALVAYERAGNPSPRPPDILMRAADAAYLSGDPQRSVDLIRESIAALESSGQTRALATCYAMLARNVWAAGDSAAALDSLRRGAMVLPADQPTREQASILAQEARILMLSSHSEAAEAKCHEALAAARETGARVEESSTLITMGCCIADRGDVDGGVTAIRAGLDIAEQVGDPDQIDRAHNNLGHVLALAGRLTDVVALTLEGEGEGDIDKIRGFRLASSGQICADALVLLGRFDDADRLLRRLGDRGIGSCVFGPNGARAEIAIRTGRLDDAERFLAAAKEMSGGLDTVAVCGSLHMMHAELALERGEPSVAITRVEQALSLAAGTDDVILAAEMCALGLRAVIDDFEDRRGRGRRVGPEKVQRQVTGLVEEADALAKPYGRRGFACPPRVQALVAQCHAEATRLAPPSPQAWRAAVAAWEVAGEPYPSVYCKWREAEAAVSTRERQRAAACAQEAWRTAVSLGARPLQARLERLASRARITLDVEEASHGQTIAADLGLTAREVEVLGQLATGRTDRQIAESLFISKKTASVHVSNLLRKLDVANRIEAGEIGQRAGL